MNWGIQRIHHSSFIVHRLEKAILLILKNLRLKYGVKTRYPVKKYL